MDAVDTAKKIGEAIATVEFVLPKTATKALRTDLLALLVNFLQDESAVSAVQDLESIY
jgi:hypothetical protein